MVDSITNIFFGFSNHKLHTCSLNKLRRKVEVLGEDFDIFEPERTGSTANMHSKVLNLFATLMDDQEVKVYLYDSSTYCAKSTLMSLLSKYETIVSYRAAYVWWLEGLVRPMTNGLGDYKYFDKTRFISFTIF